MTPDSVVLLAGFVLAHAAWSVSDLPQGEWARGMERPITFVQKLGPFSSGAFRVVGDALVVVDGRLAEGAEASRLTRRLCEGVGGHPQAGPRWRGWRGE